MTGRRAAEAGRGPSRIVCGVNGSSSSRGALVEAVRRGAAERRTVTVVTAHDAVGYAWGAIASLPGGAWLPPLAGPELRTAEEATLREFVADVLADPGVTEDAERLPAIESKAVPGRPVDVLVREAAGAVTLVVGHGEDAWPPVSVAAGCARRAPCPVVVVRPGRTPSPDHGSPRAAENPPEEAEE